MKFIVKEQDYEYEYLLAPGVIIVGRDATCDLAIDSRSVSRRHLSCSIRHGRVTVKDLGSQNGIKVNGKRVKEAELADGDEVRIGDVALTLKMSASATAGAIPPRGAAEDATGAPTEPQIENEEITPSDGSLVKVDPSQTQNQTGLFERDGRWYVADPATGREVEIVPAEEKKTHKPAGDGKSLLATRKGRMILGGLAAAVMLLLALSLLVNGDAEPPSGPGLAHPLEEWVENTLQMLARGEVEEANEMAGALAGARPESGAAESLKKLTELWGRMEEDFWDYRIYVKRALRDLEANLTTDYVRRFVTRHTARIDEAELEYAEAEQARSALEQGRYEEAYGLLAAIDEHRPARRDNVDLYDEIQTRLRSHLEDRLQRAIDRNEWDNAREASDKLIAYFPETRAELEEEQEHYATMARHAGLIRDAESAMRDGQYERAIGILSNVPETSRYYQEAVAGIEEAEVEIERAGEMATIRSAEDHFNDGEPGEALALLEGLTLAEREARTLRRRINDVREAYEAARKAEEERDYIRAQQQWEHVAELEREYGTGRSYYRRMAQNAARDLPDQRREYAAELVETAEGQYREGRYEAAREGFEAALRTDPDEEIGRDGLRRLREEGIREYMRALHEDDQERALERLETALILLPSDDTYYGRARTRKEEIRQQLEQE